MKTSILLFCFQCAFFSMAQNNSESFLDIQLYSGRITGKEAIIRYDSGIEDKKYSNGFITDLGVSYIIRKNSFEYGANVALRSLKNQYFASLNLVARLTLNDNRTFNKLNISLGRGFGKINNLVDHKAGFSFCSGICIWSIDKKHYWNLWLEDRLQVFHVKFELEGPNGILYPEPLEVYPIFNSIGLNLSMLLWE